MLRNTGQEFTIGGITVVTQNNNYRAAGDSGRYGYQKNPSTRGSLNFDVTIAGAVALRTPFSPQLFDFQWDLYCSFQQYIGFQRIIQAQSSLRQFITLRDFRLAHAQDNQFPRNQILLPTSTDFEAWGITDPAIQSSIAFVEYTVKLEERAGSGNSFDIEGDSDFAVEVKLSAQEVTALNIQAVTTT